MAAAHGGAERRRVEHEWGLGKLIRGSVRARGAWWWLSAVTRTSSEGRSGRRKQLELGVCTAR
jgi:hypothetical protein